MFSKASKAHSRDTKLESGGKSVPSIISADLKITGDLISSGEIQIDGTVEGDIECSALIIGVNGSVTGEINAESVRLHGKVEGVIRAKTVYLAATAHMVGDITHDSLAIDPGAFMEGHCGRLGAEKKESSNEFSLSASLSKRPISVVSDDMDDDNLKAEALGG
jgi:cytoskeletal protein CcmA (bactofilin family)